MKDTQHHEARTERVALVSGATGGMGEAICAALLADGLRVVMLGRDEAKLERARLALIQQGQQSMGDRLFTQVVNIGDPESIVRAMA